MSLEDLAQNLDLFDFRARVLPALLVLLPVLMGGLALAPSVLRDWESLAALALPMGLLGLLQQSLDGSDPAGEAQAALFPDAWDMPTTHLLSFERSELSPLTLARYHARLQALLPALKLPEDRKQEREMGAEALAVYRSCTDFLRERTRDAQTFRLVQVENQSYLYRLTLYSLRRAGRVSAWAGLAFAGMAWCLRMRGPLSVGAAVFCLLLVGCWHCVVRASWVKAAAGRYAARLLGACELL